MRILVLHGYGLSGSGSAVYTVDLIHALALAGHEVDLVCHEASLSQALPNALHTESPGGWARASFRVGPGSINVHAHAGLEVPVMYTRPELTRGKVITRWSGEELDRYRDDIYSFIHGLGRQAPWDAVLVNHVAGLCSVADRFSREAGTPWAVVVHGTGLLYGLPHEPLRTRVVEALGSCTNVVVLNREVRERVEDAFGGRCPPLTEVPPGVDTAQFARRPGSRPNQVAFAGRLILDKGLHHLLLAWPTVLRGCPDATLEIAGAGMDGLLLRNAFGDLVSGRPEAFVERVVEHARATGREHLVGAVPAAPCVQRVLPAEERRRLQRSVSWHGPLDRDGVASLLGTSSLGVLPAVVPEAFPLAVLEATAAGAVPVGSELSGLGWLLERIEETEPALGGRLIARTDAACPVGELSNKMLSLLGDPTARPLMDAQPRAFAERYEWRAIATRLLTAALGPGHHRVAAE